MTHQNAPVTRDDLQHSQVIDALKAGGVRSAELYTRFEPYGRGDDLLIQVGVLSLVG